MDWESKPAFEFLEKRPMPHSVEIETTVLSAMIGGADALDHAAKVLNPDDFYDGRCKGVFQTIVELRPREVDLAILTEALRARGLLEQYNINWILTWCNEAAPELIDEYIVDLKRYSMMRDVINVSTQTLKNAYEAKIDANEFINHLQSSAKNIADRYDVGRNKLPIASANAMRRKYPELRPVVVDRIGRIGDVVSIISTSGIGKSWLLEQLGLSIAYGLPFLGHFQTACMRVIKFDAELDETDLAYRYGVVANVMNQLYGDCINLDEDNEFYSFCPMRGREYNLETLCNDIESLKGRFDVVLIDPWYMLQEGDENSNSDVMKLMRRLLRVAKRCGMMIVVIHHANKGSQTHKDAIDVGAGAGSQGRAVDAHIIIRPHQRQGYYVMEPGKVRTFTMFDPMTVRKMPVDVEGGGVIWEIDASVKPELKLPKQTQNTKRDEIEEYLRDQTPENPDEWVSMTEIIDAADVSRNTAKRWLSKLVNEGLVGVNRKSGGYRWIGGGDDDYQGE